MRFPPSRHHSPVCQRPHCPRWYPAWSLRSPVSLVRSFVGDQLLLRGQDSAPRCTPRWPAFATASRKRLPFGPLDELGPEPEIHCPLLSRAAGSIAVATIVAWPGRRSAGTCDGRHGSNGNWPDLPSHRRISTPEATTMRARLGEQITLGVRALDLFTTCRLGQRPRLVLGVRRQQVHAVRHARPCH